MPNYINKLPYAQSCEEAMKLTGVEHFETRKEYSQEVLNLPFPCTKSLRDVLFIHPERKKLTQGFILELCKGYALPFSDKGDFDYELYYESSFWFIPDLNDEFLVIPISVNDYAVYLLCRNGTSGLMAVHRKNLSSAKELDDFFTNNPNALLALNEMAF